MTRKNLSDAERINWLRLARTENVGPITFRQMLRKFSTIERAISALPELARRGGRKKNFSTPSISKVEDEIAATEKIGGRIIAMCEPDYPLPLASIEDAPPIVSVLGKAVWKDKRCIGVVGARNASLNGRKMAEKLASDLGKEGFIIVSGLARGIDTSAHQSSLSTGTVAVLAGGADVVYPEENRKLYDAIAETGAIVSDQPLGGEPKAQLFPKRNRIISGMSLGVVVVEAAKHSGSLITARMALEQGREVFAVPGSPLDLRCNGTNDLIRQGATLTECSNDILCNLHPARDLSSMDSISPNDFCLTEDMSLIDDDELRGEVENSMSHSPINVNELIRDCGLPAAQVLTILLELELAGKIERHPGNMVALAA